MPSKSILIVEDEKDVRDVLAEIVAMFGYEITVLSDGDEAWKEVASAKYNLIITDLGLPGLDGGELVTAMRLNGIMTPVLIIAGVNSEKSGVDCGKVANCAFIQKPFKIGDIEDKIKELLRDSEEELTKQTR
jgi:DNA-binding response OmpR family regulator